MITSHTRPTESFAGLGWVLGHKIRLRRCLRKALPSTNEVWASNSQIKADQIARDTPVTR
jgi:hypothetical protein